MPNEEIVVKTTVKITATIEFDEGSLLALDAMVGYGVEPFLKVFYEKLGTHYMKPHEKNLRQLFQRIQETVPQSIRKVREARKLLNGGK